MLSLGTELGCSDRSGSHGRLQLFVDTTLSMFVAHVGLEMKLDRADTHIRESCHVRSFHDKHSDFRHSSTLLSLSMW